MNPNRIPCRKLLIEGIDCHATCGAPESRLTPQESPGLLIHHHPPPPRHVDGRSRSDGPGQTPVCVTSRTSGLAQASRPASGTRPPCSTSGSADLQSRDPPHSSSARDEATTVHDPRTPDAEIVPRPRGPAMTRGLPVRQPVAGSTDFSIPARLGPPVTSRRDVAIQLTPTHGRRGSSQSRRGKPGASMRVIATGFLMACEAIQSSAWRRRSRPAASS